MIGQLFARSKYVVRHEHIMYFQQRDWRRCDDGHRTLSQHLTKTTAELWFFFGRSVELRSFCSVWGTGSGSYTTSISEANGWTRYSSSFLTSEAATSKDRFGRGVLIYSRSSSDSCSDVSQRLFSLVSPTWRRFTVQQVVTKKWNSEKLLLKHSRKREKEWRGCARACAIIL